MAVFGLLLLFGDCPLCAQGPWLSFEREYEERGVMQALRPLGDSGYVAVGRILDTASRTSAIVWRLDEEGAVRWQRILAPKGSARFSDLLVLPDGMLAVGSSSQADGSDQQAWQVRFNLDGDTLWTRESAFAEGSAFEAVTASPSGWWAAGRAALPGDLPDVLLSAYAMDGSPIWTNLYGSLNLEQAFDVVRHANGDPMLTGRVFDGLRDRVYAVRAEPGSGADRWKRSYSNGNSDLGLGLVARPDGGTTLCGGSRMDGNEDGVLIGLDTAGEVEWQMLYGGLFDDRLQAIQRQDDGALFAAGRYGSISSTRPWSLRADSLGNAIWSVVDSTVAGSWEDLALAPDGAVLLSGEGDGRARLSRRGANGVLCPAVEALEFASSGNVLTLSWPPVADATAYELRWRLPSWTVDSSRSVPGTSLSLNSWPFEVWHTVEVRPWCGDLVYGLWTMDSAKREESVGLPGLAAAQAEPNWVLYPNPTTDQARIRWMDAHALEWAFAEGEGLRWRAMHSDGRILAEGPLDQPIATESWADGLYRVELVQTGEGLHRQGLAVSGQLESGQQMSSQQESGPHKSGQHELRQRPSRHRTEKVLGVRSLLKVQP
jgi:hypothetical protein